MSSCAGINVVGQVCDEAMIDLDDRDDGEEFDPVSFEMDARSAKGRLSIAGAAHGALHGARLSLPPPEAHAV